MEIEGDDGYKIELKHDGSSAAFGRGLGFNTKDRTVSRHHVLFQPCKTENQTEPRVSFQVIGKNPLWLRSGDAGSETRVFRKLEKGEVAVGDCFCISSQNPVWFKLKRIIGEESDLNGSDVSEMDPVKEFGFLVIGHEFDCYPKERICDVKNWDWFLEEAEQDSEDDDSDKKKKKRSGRRKRRKNGGNAEDDDWTVESEEDKETVSKIRKIGRSKYSTRSKDKNKLDKKDEERKKESWQSKAMSSNEEDSENEDEDEDDDTLGGFIVDDDGDDEEQVGESDEEKEFIDGDEEELED
ncbi:hypothetical protein JCGZ_24755 [Jatropha curcas]|uniref:FHA domain-containing protein n=1 Tax=Jatropha curcas TaxID=180498 RepID=A0A067KX48_JATCU|nr:mitotic apparatus protein p62 [Jatropha curcas]KDP40756.1 hypothetical protein JCGZ_24755 [Jatropha curcas]